MEPGAQPDEVTFGVGLPCRCDPTIRFGIWIIETGNSEETHEILTDEITLLYLKMDAKARQKLILVSQRLINISQNVWDM